MRAPVDCRKTKGGDAREEIVVGMAGGKAGSHGNKAILSHPIVPRMGWNHHHTPLSPHASTSS